MRTGPNIRKRADGRFEARYEKSRDESGRIVYGYCYGKTYEEAEAKRDSILGITPANTEEPRVIRRMNLLILGAGSQGPVVKEIAEAIGIFDEIAFLDDDQNNTLAIGTLNDLTKLKNRFPLGIASFGDSYMREKWMDELERNDYIVPSLIHPSATISPNAKLDRSVVIEARCIVSAGAVVGRGALLSGASVVEANGVVGEFVHLGSSSIVSKGAIVADNTRIPSGTVVRA